MKYLLSILTLIAVGTFSGCSDAAGAPPKKKVAILIFDGVQIIDYTGPWEVFGQARWEVFTVAESEDIVSTVFDMKVKPQYTFDNAPKADILLLPGGNLDDPLNNEKVMAWIKKTVPTMEQTLSVCNGAFFLGLNGFLDDQKATTFASAIDDLQRMVPKAQVVRNERFTDNGKIITSAGLSSGIDAAIHLVGKYQGVGNAQRIATHLEYDWNPDHGYVRATLADLKLRSWRPFISKYDTDLQRYEGDTDHWTIEYVIHTDQTLVQLQKELHREARDNQLWKQGEDAWTFTADNQTWNGVITLTEAGKDKLLTLKILKTHF